MRNLSTKILYFLLFALVFSMTACTSKGDISDSERQSLMKLSRTHFKILPNRMPGSENDSKKLIDLGEKLYFDTRLSENDKISCNSCHIIDGKKGGVDNLPTSPGTRGKNGDRNSPTVLNAGLQFVQFWDGRAADLKEQAKGPILNSVEMAMPGEDAVVRKLRTIPEYTALFAAAFPDASQPLTYDNLAEAIAAFERTLITRDRFDDFLRGNIQALSTTELNGLNLFMQKGCTTCHTGALLGGNQYQKMGLIKPYENIVDTGRYHETGIESDRYMFKVPILRNIKLTGPYFHDGAEPDLHQAVIRMAKMQLGLDLLNMEALPLVSFLETLTDKKLAAANLPETQN